MQSPRWLCRQALAALGLESREEGMKGRRGFLLFCFVFILSWHCHTMAPHIGNLADVESCLLVSWALLWVQQQSLPGTLAAMSDAGRALVSKCCWFIGPQASSWFSRDSITASSCCWSPSAFPSGLLGMDRKWLKATSRSSVQCESSPQDTTLP